MPKSFSFACCNRTTQSLCCRQCLGMFHPNCLEKRQDWTAVSEHIICCSQECFDKVNTKDTDIGKYKNAIELLKEELDQKDATISKLKRRSEHFESDVIEAEKNYEDNIKKLTLTNESMHNKISGFEEKMAKLQKENESLQQSVTQYNSEKIEMTSTQKELVTHIESLRQDCVQKDIELETLRSQISHIRSARPSHNTSERNVRSLRVELDQQIHEIATIVKTDIQSIFEKKFELLQHQIKSLENIQQVQHSTLDNKKTEKTSKSRKSQNLEGKDKSMNSSSTTTEREKTMNNNNNNKKHLDALNDIRTRSHQSIDMTASKIVQKKTTDSIKMSELTKVTRESNTVANMKPKSADNGKQAISTLESTTRQKFNELIHLASDTVPIDKNSPSSAGRVQHTNKLAAHPSDWQKMSYKRNKNHFVVGNNDDTSIKGVPKHVSLHVTRVDPTTKAAELTNLLKPHFPEISCESITPKHPTVYGSFKVTIYEQNFRMAMNPSVWPKGAYVSRFFQKRITQNHSPN